MNLLTESELRRLIEQVDFERPKGLPENFNAYQAHIKGALVSFHETAMNEKKQTFGIGGEGSFYLPQNTIVDWADGWTIIPIHPSGY